MAFIKKNFVPVVITVHGECKDAEGAFWKSFCKDYAWITGAAHGVTPTGKVLCSDAKRSSCGGRSVCDPQKVYQRWLELSDEERRPGAVKVEDLKEMDPAFPKRPAGSLLLKGYNRPLERGADGRLKRLKDYRDCQELGKNDSNWRTFVEPEPGRVFLWFTQEQWKSILPAEPKAGLKYPIPEAVGDRMVRLTLLNTIY